MLFYSVILNLLDYLYTISLNGFFFLMYSSIFILFYFCLFVFICLSVEFLMTVSYVFFDIKNNLFFSTGHLRQNCLWEKRQRKITVFNILTAALHEETSVLKFMFNSQWSLIKLLRCVLLGFWACIEKSFALAEFRLKLTFFFFSLSDKIGSSYFRKKRA